MKTGVGGTYPCGVIVIGTPATVFEGELAFNIFICPINYARSIPDIIDVIYSLVSA